MQIITLITDLGNADYYLGALKGSLLKECSPIQIIDVATQINSFDIRHGAYVLGKSFSFFPENTIHFLHLNAPESKGKMIVARHQNQYIVSFDNGAIPLALGEIPQETYVIHAAITESKNLLFTEGIVAVVNAIAQQVPLETIGTKTQQIRQLTLLKSFCSDGNIRGNILHFDKYGNGITNIYKKEMQQYIGDKNFVLYLNGLESNEILSSYADVPNGEFVCFFNAEDCLEIAINKGKAIDLLALKKDNQILIQRV
jgi:hypothetical protein